MNYTPIGKFIAQHNNFPVYFLSRDLENHRHHSRSVNFIFTNIMEHVYKDTRYFTPYQNEQIYAENGHYYFTFKTNEHIAVQHRRSQIHFQKRIPHTPRPLRHSSNTR